MTGIAVARPRGIVPKIAERELADNQATEATNCKLTSGACTPLKGLGLVHTSLAASIATMYRYRFQDTYNWLVSTLLVDYKRSTTAQDVLGRFYYTGDGEPRMSTYADAISGPGPYPNAWYVLGVVFPVTAATIVVTGGVGLNEDRQYVYTFKTRYGEESGPSPMTAKTGKVDGSWDISGMDTAPPNNGTVTAATANTPLPGQVEVTLDTVFGLAAYEQINFANVLGMTDLNGKFALVSVNAVTKKVVVTLATAQVFIAGGNTWTRVAPHNVTGMTKRIYRTIGSNTDYKLVAEIAVANATYSDVIPAATVSLNSGITTLDNFPPPKNMHSIIELANGCHAGLAGNEFCMSEQGKPYSWPIAYRQSFAGTGISQVAAGNSAIILTDSYPLLATATVPEQLSITKLPGDTLAPCVSKAGVVDIGSGAIYPSHDGLYVATTSGARNITDGLYGLEEWQRLVPGSFKAAFSDHRYYAMHDGYSGQPARIFMLHTKEPDSAIEFSEQVTALYGNPWDGQLYVAKAKQISQWDADDANRYLSFWTAKTFQLSQKVNFSAAQVQAKYSDIVPIVNPGYNANLALLTDINLINGSIGSAPVGAHSIGGSALQIVSAQAPRTLQFTLVRNGVPVFNKVLTSSKPFKLPAGVKSDLYSVRISASIPWDSVNIAEGMAELRTAPV